jgi:hypothetical protein
MTGTTVTTVKREIEASESAVVEGHLPGVRGWTVAGRSKGSNASFTENLSGAFTSAYSAFSPWRANPSILDLRFRSRRSELAFVYPSASGMAV